MRRSLHALLVTIPFAVSPALFAGPVDINRADAATLAKELDGIGPSHAKAIVDYREKHGAYKSVEDLAKVKGIGTKAVEKNRANIRLGDAAKK